MALGAAKVRLKTAKKDESDFAEVRLQAKARVRANVKGWLGLGLGLGL
jgi:hypothetical protein